MVCEANAAIGVAFRARNDPAVQAPMRPVLLLTPASVTKMAAGQEADTAGRC